MMIYSEEEFLAEVLAIPSVNGTDDERKIAWFLAEYLKNCGVNAVVQEIDDTHANVIAVLAGKTEEKVVWNGHLDTVPYGKISEWDTQPYIPVKKNGCFYARGSSDMKSGLAAMVYVLGRMKQKGHVPKQTIYFFGICDEEKGGIGASHIKEENLMENASLLLIGEPTGLRVGLAQNGGERTAFETDAQNKWVKRIVKELKKEELPEDCLSINYFIDASILKQGIQDIPTVLFGPGEAQMAHKPNEYVEIKKYLQYIRMLTRLF